MLAFNNIGSLGRLGNQMFEYAALRGIAARHGYEFCIPTPDRKGIENYVYHLEHARGENSWFNNPYMEGNNAEWDKIQGMSKDNLLKYYSEQEYLQKYAGL